MLGIADFIWRLIPGNPILLRVVSTGGKRRRDMLIRSAYLGLLVVLVIFSLLTIGSESFGSLDKLAGVSARLFQQMSYLQLGLVALLAPIFTAGAITQEKDSQTYDILLATPLTNGQIVLGSLLSRLFFVIALLVSGIPIFSVTQIFGGVAIRSIVHSFLIAAATAFVTGALAMAIATFKVGTRRTIFSFYLFIALYLVGVFLLDRLDWFHPVTAKGERALTSWLTGLHPFLALRVIFNNQDYLPPALGDLPADLHRWPWGWYLSSPHTFYVSFMFFLSAVLVLPSIGLLRRVAQSTTLLRTWVLQKLHIVRGDRRRKPRGVWNNPVAWREAKTKASAARASMLRYSFIGAGLAGAVVLLGMFSIKQPARSFIDRNSINWDQRLISVVTGDRATTYSFDPRTTPLTLGGQEATWETLRGGTFAADVRAKGNKLVALDARSIPRRLDAPQARAFLLGAIIIEFAVILLIVTNAAASTVTREKEDGTLDLLLTTPITSRYYIWGKLRGLVSFVLPLIAVPVLSVAIFVGYDLLRRLTGGGSQFEWIVLPEAVLIMPGTLIIVAAFAAIVGMHMSLRCRKTITAVMASVGIVVGACVVLGGCGFSLLDRASSGATLVIASFSPFTVLTVLVAPAEYAGRIFTGSSAEDIVAARVMLVIFSWAATGAYAALVWTMYRSMVKNFDMTIRRQSR